MWYLIIHIYQLAQGSVPLQMFCFFGMLKISVKNKPKNMIPRKAKFIITIVGQKMNAKKY